MSQVPAQEQKGPGGHYSGKNKIPTVNEFVQRLDRDKASRDANIDAQRSGAQQGGDDVKPHQNEVKHTSENQQTVTDPTTGKQIVIEDVNEDMRERAKNPTLSVPNANLGKETTQQTTPHQSNPEYKEKQDITAPPDPIAEGSTSDVPIHGEKTNILFHPTPSISYEPMFKRVEERGLILIIGIFFAIVIVGRVFGGGYLGLIPLGGCVSSGVWLWIKVWSAVDARWNGRARLSVARPPLPTCFRKVLSG